MCITRLYCWCLDAKAGPRLVQYVLPDPGIIRVLGQDRVADINSIHKPPCLHVVKGKFIPCKDKEFQVVFDCSRLEKLSLFWNQINLLNQQVRPFLFLPTYHRICVAAELPRLFIVEGSIPVALFLLHDEAHVLVSLHAGPVVLKNSLGEK